MTTSARDASCCTATPFNRTLEVFSSVVKSLVFHWKVACVCWSRFQRVSLCPFVFDCFFSWPFLCPVTNYHRPIKTSVHFVVPRHFVRQCCEVAVLLGVCHMAATASGLVLLLVSLRVAATAAQWLLLRGRLSLAPLVLMVRKVGPVGLRTVAGVSGRRWLEDNGSS